MKQKSFIIISILSCAVFNTKISLADQFSVRIEPGIALPLSSPQTEVFDPGVGVVVKPAVSITPFLDLAPSYTGIFLPAKHENANNGTASALGVGVRLKSPHSSSKNDKLLEVSPWIDFDVQYVRTGDLNRIGYAVGAGASTSVDKNKSFWIGPFVRFQNIFGVQEQNYDNRDIHTFMGGISLEFDLFNKNKQQKNNDNKQKNVVTPKENETKVITTNQVEKSDKISDIKENVISLEQKIQFEAGSANILSNDSKKNLDLVLEKILNKSNCYLVIEGHASSEGPPEPYNTKLSERRALAVQEYLMKRGVLAKQIITEAHSSQKPVANNETLAGRIKNRRVEFKLHVFSISQ